MTGGPGTDDPAFRAAVDELLGQAGIGSATNLEPLPGGANNRVYRLAAGDRRFVLKRYFHTAADPRDRFTAERAFYTWALSRGCIRVPRPLAWNAASRLGLFEWVEGRKLAPGEVTADPVDQAVALVLEVNPRGARPADGDLPVASEACFSIAAHLDRIGGRVERLRGFEVQTAIDAEAAAFVATGLGPAWETVRTTALGRAGDAAGAGQELPAPQRCVSPSDFGFHNALVPSDGGTIRFLDFEYAGWDDPAKLACDFFCQPQVPVPIEHWERVLSRLDAGLDWGGRLAERAGILLPAYRLKWCCIMLNEFLRTDRARREFAQGGGAVEAKKATQLAKARAALAEAGRTIASAD